MKLILGSQSASRKKMLQKAGYKFEVMIPDIDEQSIRSNDYEALPLYIAQAKASKLISQIFDGVMLVTADTVVTCNRELREKPQNRAQAREFLTSYINYPAITNTAVVVTNTATGAQAGGVDISTTYFKSLTPEAIETILDTNIWVGAAGAFIVDDTVFEKYISRIDGNSTGVMGLPISLMEELMKKVK